MPFLFRRNNHVYYAGFSNVRRRPPQKRLSLRTRDKRTAWKRFLQLEQDYEYGRFDPWTDDPWTYNEGLYQNVTLGTALDRFLERKRVQRRSPNTLRTYRGLLRLLVRNVGPTCLLRRISDRDCRTVVYASGIAPATVYKRYGHFLSFFNWCEEEGYVLENPMSGVVSPPKPSVLPRSITRSQLQVLCESVWTDYKEKRSRNCILRGQLVWRIPLFWFAFYTGMRGEELARLRWRHIDFEKRLLYVLHQKNRNEQTIPLSGVAITVLEGVEKGTAADYVFRSPGYNDRARNPLWFRQNVSRAFRRARTKAGLPDGLSFHSLRHGFCTALAEAGASAVVIKEADRPADVATTMRYAHMARPVLRKEINRVFGVGSGLREGTQPK